MAEDDQTGVQPAGAPPVVPAPQQPAPPAQEPVFTQAQVNSIMANQKRELTAKFEAKAPQTPQPKPPEQRTKAKGDTGGDEIMQRLEAFETQLAAERTARQFAEAAVAAGVTPEQAAALKPMYEAIGPDDGAAWIKQTLAAFGAPSTAAAAPPAADPATTPPATAPPSAPGATTAFDRGQVSIGDMTAAQIAATDPAELYKMAKKKYRGR